HPGVAVDLSRQAHPLRHLADLCAASAGLLEPRLRHLDVDERAQRVTECGGVEPGRPGGQHAARLELVEPGLSGPAGHAEPPGELAHADPWIVEHDSEEPPVGVVKVVRWVHVSTLYDAEVDT